MKAHSLTPRMGLYTTAGLRPAGRVYWIKDHHSDNGILSRLASAYREIFQQGYVERLQNAIEAHSADRSLNKLSQAAGLSRLSKVKTNFAPAGINLN